MINLPKGYETYFSITKEVEDQLNLTDKETQFKNGHTLSLEEMLQFSSDTGLSFEDTKLFRNDKNTEYYLVNVIGEDKYRGALMYDLETEQGCETHKNVLTSIMELNRDKYFVPHEEKYYYENRY